MRGRTYTDLRRLPANQNGLIRILPEHIMHSVEGIGRALETLAGALFPIPSGVVVSSITSRQNLRLYAIAVNEYGAVLAFDGDLNISALGNDTYPVALTPKQHTESVTFVDPSTGETITHILSVRLGQAEVITAGMPDGAVEVGRLTISDSTATFIPNPPPHRITAGDNANGTFLKLGNGIQLCWATGTTSAGEYTWTFPSPFTAPPVVQATPIGITAPYIVGVSAVGPGSVTIKAWGWDGSGFSAADIQVALIAIGKA